jgi:hypothetical protein
MYQPGPLVDACIEFFDREQKELPPTWRDLINLDKLDMSDPRKCLLAQLCGNYAAGLDRLRISRVRAPLLGLTYGAYGAPESKEAQLEALTAEFKRRIVEHRAAA